MTTGISALVLNNHSKFGDTIISKNASEQIRGQVLCFEGSVDSLNEENTEHITVSPRIAVMSEKDLPGQVVNDFVESRWRN